MPLLTASESRRTDISRPHLCWTTVDDADSKNVLLREGPSLSCMSAGILALGHWRGLHLNVESSEENSTTYQLAALYMQVIHLCKLLDKPYIFTGLRDVF